MPTMDHKSLMASYSATLTSETFSNGIGRLDRKAVAGFQDVLPVYAQLNHEANKPTPREVWRV